MGKFMHLLLALAGAVALAAGVPALGLAAQAQHVNINIDETFQSDFLSEACGVPVFIDVVADLNVTLVYNKSGLIVREIDSSGGGTVTYRSPDTGKSFSYPYFAVQLDYGSGAVVGSDVILSFTGVFGRVTGFIPPNAGLFRFKGVVTGFDEFEGVLVPFTDFVEVIADRGNREDGDAVGAAICAALIP